MCICPFRSSPFQDVYQFLTWCVVVTITRVNEDNFLPVRFRNCQLSVSFFTPLCNHLYLSILWSSPFQELHPVSLQLLYIVSDFQGKSEKCFPWLLIAVSVFCILVQSFVSVQSSHGFFQKLHPFLPLCNTFEHLMSWWFLGFILDCLPISYRSAFICICPFWSLFHHSNHAGLSEWVDVPQWSFNLTIVN